MSTDNKNISISGMLIGLILLFLLFWVNFQVFRSDFRPNLTDKLLNSPLVKQASNNTKASFSWTFKDLTIWPQHNFVTSASYASQVYGKYPLYIHSITLDDRYSVGLRKRMLTIQIGVGLLRPLFQQYFSYYLSKLTFKELDKDNWEYLQTMDFSVNITCILHLHSAGNVSETISIHQKSWSFDRNDDIRYIHAATPARVYTEGAHLERKFKLFFFASSWAHTENLLFCMYIHTYVLIEKKSFVWAPIENSKYDQQYIAENLKSIEIVWDVKNDKLGYDIGIDPNIYQSHENEFCFNLKQYQIDLETEKASNDYLNSQRRKSNIFCTARSVQYHIDKSKIIFNTGLSTMVFFSKKKKTN
ncbi:hypothetical protein RFI_29039 [Reticulomyxa filosa]|uniref:Uncharacterized protein n=1 Tax=Reticulomyxa filosa TaxID=46433 RepID=X6M324_RETFI|nr:hypothetical protein RFI_29039 [Reticulomyxa filosa]|eukprot:ETO08349.1 hypothetical protein RFI_29039 [Reticulomyxa filosa]